MVLSINIPADVEARLRHEAARQGLDVSEYATQLVVRHLPSPAGSVRDQATLDLLAQWDREDATDDPEQIARADVVVATSNPVHLSRFLTADVWQNL